MVSIGVAMHVLPLCMHSLTIAVHAECTAVMLGYHFMPLQVLQHNWCLLLNAACHSSQRSIPYVYQAAATASVHKNFTMYSHMLPRFALSQMRIETAAFTLQLTSACIWSAGQHAEPTCESSIGVA